MANSELLFLHRQEFSNHIESTWKQSWENPDFCDVTLACEDKEFLAHKVIICSSSSVFTNILKNMSSPHPCIYLKGVKLVDLQSILNYIYKGEVSIAEKDLNSFLEVARELKIKGLSQNDTTKNDIPSNDYRNIAVENLNKTQQLCDFDTEIQSVEHNEVLPIEVFSNFQNRLTENVQDVEVDNMKNLPSYGKNESVFPKDLLKNDNSNDHVPFKSDTNLPTAVENIETTNPYKMPYNQIIFNCDLPESNDIDISESILNTNENTKLNIDSSLSMQQKSYTPENRNEVPNIFSKEMLFNCDLQESNNQSTFIKKETFKVEADNKIKLPDYLKSGLASLNIKRGSESPENNLDSYTMFSKEKGFGDMFTDNNRLETKGYSFGDLSLKEINTTEKLQSHNSSIFHLNNKTMKMSLSDLDDNVGEPANKLRKKQTYYSGDEKEMLKSIINTSNNGKYWAVLNDGEHKNNILKSDYWNEITNIFNAATGKNYAKKQLRDLYSKLKLTENNYATVSNHFKSTDLLKENSLVSQTQKTENSFNLSESPDILSKETFFNYNLPESIHDNFNDSSFISEEIHKNEVDKSLSKEKHSKSQTSIKYDEFGRATNKIKKTRIIHSLSDKQTLKAIINTSNNGKYWAVLNDGESKNNSLKCEYWTEITNLFISATGKNVDKKKLRDMYNKIKHKQKMDTGLYPCDQCEYKATVKESLKKHMVIHNGIYYSCNFCNYKSTQESGLKLHMDANHSGVLFPCDKCDFETLSKDSLVNHMLKVH